MGTITSARGLLDLPQFRLGDVAQASSKPCGVVNGVLKRLLAPEVVLRGLDRHATPEKLNLLQFAAGEMAERSVRR